MVTVEKANNGIGTLNSLKTEEGEEVSDVRIP